jgi:hypothetical protein
VVGLPDDWSKPGDYLSEELGIEGIGSGKIVELLIDFPDRAGLCFFEKYEILFFISG